MTQKTNLTTTLRDLIAIAIGCAIYAFGLITINIQNHLAEGGLTGITLIVRYWLHIDPAYTTLILNIPLVILGYKFLGKRALAYTIYGTVMMSVFLWIWQRVPVTINLNHDIFIAALLAGLCGGFGSGIIYRYGGTTGGSDVIARIIEKRRGVQMGRSLLIFDIFVLTASLSYLDIEHMMYTLIASYVFSRVVNFTLEGTYAAKGLLVVSDHYQKIADQIMSQTGRGVTFLHAEGGYSHQSRQMIYCVVSASEVAHLKRIIEHQDPKAFISIIDVHEALGEGFTYETPTKD
ncbi:YitT family protein [Latilactobacillus sakei]|uniref:YitT family protein n=2 Tax=Bacteria TaxID=2 RepID=A0AAE8LUW8_LATSK|nr:YitT family protein [Latilactobacillus sakei]USS37850.1 YitT family protein [Latilactobacillus sakei]WEY49490.1 YitT family protein [Latilactobacillus sakei]WGI18283.1 YitT family protein [Latilactobacillus sakei]SPE18967.1 hypothetical protein LAS9267_00455 [Latilactobacillus sakei]